ncbi:MAG: hypothetical protein M3367_13780 [Acidobacteriota bacterium]|nr:hypothetical protein [Acidobacteriota bacterium]
MNEQKKSDFFPEISERYTAFAAPEIPQGYEETEEDRLMEKRLNELSLQSGESDDDSTEWGEFPYDAEADRKRWDELEKDFDRIFDEAEKVNL